jgi:CarboxypepD_reg-like domain
MSFRLFIVLLLASAVVQAAEVKGKVITAVGGEALGRVQVLVLENKASAITSDTGDFDIPNLPAGSFTLRINAVGYRLLTVPFTLASAFESKEFSITLVPDNFRHTDRVEVHADLFQIADSPATNEMNLTSSEIRETSTVFADDPFRAVQTLPGVSAAGNNEFFAEFTVSGTPFQKVGTYIDDVLVQNPFHEIGKFNDGASLGVLTSEVVEDMKLLPAAYPEKFGDADGAALDVHTRVGSRGSPLFRISAGLVASEILAEGGIGSARRGSWLLSARKSYINYLVHGRERSAADVGFYDGNAKLDYDVTARQNISFFATGGHTTMRLTDPTALENYEYASGRSDFTFARAGWRWAASPQLLMDAHAAYYAEPDKLFNNANAPLSGSDHREWVGGGGFSWAWSADQVLQAGWSERHLRDSLFSADPDGTGGLAAQSFAGTALRQSGFIQQASGLLRGRVHLLGSLRWDAMSGYALHPLSPQISAALRATRSTEFQFATGRYRQFASRFQQAGTGCFPLGFLPEEATHYTAAVEQRLGENTRIRVEAFSRHDSSSLGLIQGASGSLPLPGGCPSLEPITNSVYKRTYSRGAQLIVQRRSSNRLSGWLGYTYVQAREREYQVATPIYPYSLFYNVPYYPTLEDQRHTVNVFAMYRLRPSLNLSGKYLFGSGFPIPSGTYLQLGNGEYVAVGVNQTRLGIYQRLDLRADKDWVFRRWKLTLYGEALNVTNHYNARYYYSSGIDPVTGQVLIKTLQGIPITPTAGLAFQF